ncbi:MAG TPA: hypothetical protein P5328_03045 [Candidatus Paceibacterota bacterium]|nr:hypothetical protein [Candidatus Paceibacterota bacterium]HRZ34619.1 hypothetical protein [Candidatus Paceibacterota bacterium]
MRRWIRFFFGSPRRAVATLSVVAILWLVNWTNPGLIAGVAMRTMHELQPLIEGGIILLIMYGGFRMIIYGLKK